MDINDLTIGQTKELVAMFGDKYGKTAKADSSSNKYIDDLIGAQVIVRSRDSGVHYGTLASKSGDEVFLTNSRRLWKWVCAKGDFLSGVAKYGITSDSKVGCSIDIVVLGVCEIIECTDEAAASIEAQVSHNE